MLEKISDILIRELAYSDYEAEITANDLLNLHTSLKPYFDKWLTSREITDITVEGYSIKNLMETRDFTFPSAIIAMDWLLTEPDIAKKALADNVKR